MEVTDKSRPEVISDIFGVSKKVFKKAIGDLYKKRLITLEEDGIRLKEKSNKPIAAPKKGQPKVGRRKGFKRQGKKISR